MDNKATKEVKKIRKNDNSIKYKIEYQTTALKVLQSRGWTRVHGPKETNWDLWWCDTSEIKQALEGKLKPHQRVSHFLKHMELTRKNYLYRNLRRYKQLLLKAGKTREAQLCDSMPMTFELPGEYRMFIEEHRKSQGTTWIVKPAAGSQGKGIFLFQKLKDLIEWRMKLSVSAASCLLDVDCQYSQDIYIVQKYIDNPYLLGGRKFDLRIYVLVTSFQPLKVWLAREGFARLSGEQFTLERIDERRVHLTNVSIQLRSEKSEGKNENTRNNDKDEAPRLGCKWALCNLRKYLTEQHGAEVVDELLRNIAGVIMASLQAVQSVIVSSRHSFELYGYDVLIDAQLKPWLLEANASPSLGATDSADFRLKFNLVDDVLNVLDFERLLTGRETRVGGLDLLWNDGPVWTSTLDGSTKLNIFLGAENDREEQLLQLRDSIANGSYHFIK